MSTKTSLPVDKSKWISYNDYNRVHKKINVDYTLLEGSYVQSTLGSDKQLLIIMKITDLGFDKGRWMIGTNSACLSHAK